MKTAELHTQRLRYESSMNTFFFLLVSGRNFSGYITSRTPTQLLFAYTLHMDSIHSSYHPHLFQPAAYSLHVLTLPSNMLHPQFSTENTCLQFTLDTRCISCYFCSTRIRLPLLHWQISKRSPSQIFIVQRVKARAIPYPHQPPSRGDNMVSVAQGGTATPGATKQLLPPDRVLRDSYIYIRQIN